MYEPDLPPFPARVTAGVALLRAGLERAARRAGLRLVGPSEPALIALHAGSDVGDIGDVGDGAAVDVTAACDRVTVTVVGDLSPEAWTALHALVRELLGPSDQR